MLTAAVERLEIVQALQLGARGVVMKEAATQLLMKAIRTVMAGQYWIGREAVGDIVEFMRTNPSGEKPPRNYGLTKREMDILTTIVAGLSNKEIARKIFAQRRHGQASSDQHLRQGGRRQPAGAGTVRHQQSADGAAKLASESYDGSTGYVAAVEPRRECLWPSAVPSRGPHSCQ